MILSFNIGPKYHTAPYSDSWLSGVAATLNSTTRGKPTVLDVPDPDFLHKHWEQFSKYHGLNPWWCKMELFNHKFQPEHPVLYWFDLDVLFLQDLDKLLDTADILGAKYPIVGIRDFVNPSHINTSVLRIDRRHPEVQHLYTDFLLAGTLENAAFYSCGDQTWLNKQFISDLWATLPDELTASYKAVVHPQGWASNRVNDLDKASVLVFHGKPMIHEVALDIEAPLHQLVRCNW